MSREKGGLTGATMETQKRGQSSPLITSLSQSLCSSNLPCRFPRRWTGIHGSSWLSETRTHQWKSSLEKPVLQIALASCLLVPSVVHHSAHCSPFHLAGQLLFPPSWYHLHSDIRVPLSVFESWEHSEDKTVIAKRADDPLHLQKDRYERTSVLERQFSSWLLISGSKEDELSSVFFTNSSFKSFIFILVSPLSFRIYWI